MKRSVDGQEVKTMKDQNGNEYEMLANEGKNCIVKRISGTVKFLGILLPNGTVEIYHKLGREVA